MTPSVSIITATIRGRENMLAELKASVAAQSFRDFEHIVELDDNLAGCSATVNKAVKKAQGEWLFLIADDDLVLPFCLEHHLSVSEGADVVYAPPVVWGIHDPWWFFQSPPAIPATALIRKDKWVEWGGYSLADRVEEDRRVWITAVESGARFVRYDGGPTWVYRLHGDNKSFVGKEQLLAAA